MTDRFLNAGSELFIVDNADSEWNVLRYLTGWCRLSSGLDIASAYFEIGSLLSLDQEWQKVDVIRILMGDEVTKRTKSAIAQGLTGKLDESLEAHKVRDDFLDGVPAIVDAIKAGRIQFRVYRKTKFHAKSYITHAREEVVGIVSPAPQVSMHQPLFKYLINACVVRPTPVGTDQMEKEKL